MAFRPIVVALLTSACCMHSAFAAVHHAAHTNGACGGSVMSATQYSEPQTTASGQAFRPDGLTAAHRSLPFGTKIRVTNPRTGQSTIVTINDRGPFTRGRDIDLSRGAARAIGLVDVGVVCSSIL
jgi:rare lipoprotein A